MRFITMNYAAEWQSLTQAALEEIRLEDSGDSVQEQRAQSVVRSLPHFMLMCFCEQEREKHAFRWEPLDGFKPAHLYLIQKHSWTLQTVREMTVADLCLALHEELVRLQLPDAAKNAIQSDVVHYEVTGLGLKL